MLLESLKLALTGVPGLSHVLGMGILFPAEASVVTFLAKARSGGWNASLKRMGFGNPSLEDNAYRVAIATGYLMHRAAESRISRGYSAAQIDTAESDQAKLYQDATIIRSLLPSPPQSLAEAAAILSVLDQRLWIKIHTLRPDGTDEKGWVLKLLAWDAAKEALNKSLAAAIASPDIEKRSRYVESPNFFDSTSPLVSAARSQNAAQLVSLEAASDPAISSVPHQRAESSLYGQALAECIQVVNQVNQFLQGSIDEKALTSRLNNLQHSL